MRRYKFHVKHIFRFLAFLPLACLAQKSNKVSIQVRGFPALPPYNAEVHQFVSSFTETKNLGSTIGEWFYWTNYSRHSPKAFWDSVVAPILQVYPQFNTSYATSLKKELYKNKRLPMLKPNQTLIRLAQAHANDLSKAGNLSHTSTNGTAFEQRIFKGGIAKCAAENLSLGIPNSVFSLVLLYLDEGIPDLGHRNNLLSPYYVEMGIGLSKTRSNYALIVQDFACDQGGR
jgi:uncharacterized protein YkwD